MRPQAVLVAASEEEWSVRIGSKNAANFQILTLMHRRSINAMEILCKGERYSRYWIL